MPLEIRLLGGVDALADGEPLPLGGRKQRAVLAMLALSANRTVAAEELIDGLWGDHPPASAAKNVQLYVSRLRRVLGGNGEEARIETHGRGYALEVPADAVDALRFERLVERARREADEGITDGALQSAPELWRGAPLADVASEPFAAAEIRHLEELHLQAIELRIDAELAAGCHGEALGELASLIAAHPLNERFHAQRMLALYRVGRQSEAIEAYREASRALIAEIGTGPGPELRELQEAILRQDPGLEARPPPQELPPQLEGGSPLLAGRERELRWLRRRWQEAAPGPARIALLSGPAGIGKTRLAAELAAELRRRGTAVLYATGSGAPDAARKAVREATETERPALLVVDDADDAATAVLEAAAALADEPRSSPLLILVLHQDEQAPPMFAALEGAGVAQRLALRPLQVEAAAEIAALYAPADDEAMPLETLIAESDAVPLRVHRAASEWAQAHAAEQLEAAVGDAATGQRGLRAARAKVAGGVADLQVARERTSLYVVEEAVGPSAPEACPFRGLAPFDSAHAEYFFGRERLVATLVARLVGSTLLAVVGPSGSGKSSAIKAGLMPALAEGVLPGSERWRQVVMRPGEHPLGELRRALARVAPGASGVIEPDGDDPLAALDSLPAEERLVLAVDQLEEIFTACREEPERAAFCAALVAAAADPDQRVVVVAGIRADFYGRCATYPKLADRMSANNVLVGPLRRDELRRSIELPARRAGLRVEPELIAALVGDVAEEPGGLPLLSTTLVELWEERDGRTLHRAAYDRSGGLSGAVARLAERAYRRLTAPQRDRARTILLRLADAEAPTPVRRRVPLSELEAERDDDRATALAVLTESRLVTVDEGAVEVAHEALLSEWPRLRDWLAADVEGRRLHQHLVRAAAEWQRSGREPAELYRGARLASALDWAEAHDPDLNERERDFLDESRAASEREAERQRRTNRRLTALLAGVGVLLVLAAVAGLIARAQRQEARDAATAEAAQRLGAQALTEDRLDRALRLAAAGAALDDSLATRSSLLAALLRSPAAIGVFSDDKEFGASALSPDGRTLALGAADGTVQLYDTETMEPIGDHRARGPVWVLDFDPRGESLALSASVGPDIFRGSIQVLDAETARLRESIPLGHHPLASGPGLGYFPGVAYAPDGRSLIAVYSTGDTDYSVPLFVRRFDPRDGAPLSKAVRAAPRSSSTPQRMTPDGRLIVTTDRATHAVDAETLRVVRTYGLGGPSAELSADGSTLATETTDGAVRLLDLATGQVRTLAGRQDPESGQGIGAFSPDGRTLATWAEDETVVLWDVARGVPIETLAGSPGNAAVFSSDGRTLYTAGLDGLTIWDIAGGRRLGHPFTTGLRTIREDAYPPAFTLSPDGRTLAVARLDGTVELIDAETLRRRAVFEAFEETPATAIEYSPDGQRLAVAGGRGLIGLWDSGSGRRIGALLDAPQGACADPSATFTMPRCYEGTIQGALAFAGDDLLAAANIRGELRIWDLDDREPLHPPLRLPPFVLELAFSPDRTQIAVPFGYNNRGPDGLEVRNVVSGERVARLRTDEEVRSVAFSPNGGRLVGGQVDGTVVVWATDDWQQVGRPLSVGRGFVLGLDFSPDGETLAASNFDGTVALWDPEAPEPIGSPLPGPADWVTARFTPDGRRLFVVYENGPAFRWEVDPAVWRAHACAIAGGGLTPGEWEEVVPEQDYVSACPSG